MSRLLRAILPEGKYAGVTSDCNISKGGKEAVKHREPALADL
jgi:hypothetical protein